MDVTEQLNSNNKLLENRNKFKPQITPQQNITSGSLVIRTMAVKQQILVSLVVIQKFSYIVLSK